MCDAGGGRHDVVWVASAAPFSTLPQGAERTEGRREGERGGDWAVTMADSCGGSVRWTPVAFTGDSETVLPKLLSFTSPDALPAVAVVFGGFVTINP